MSKFDKELSPKGIGTSDSQRFKIPEFEKNVHHAKRVEAFKESQWDAKRIIEDAQKKAVTEAEKIKKEAFEKGYEEGKSKAATEDKTYVSDVVKSFSNLTKELISYKENLIKETEKQLLRLVVETANKIISAKIQEDDEVVLRVVKQALKDLVDRETLTIKVNPKDAEVMKKEKISLIQELDGIKKLTIMEDESIKRGGCYIQTTTSEVDARIEKQLDIIQKTFESK
jgi:flagellar assembly protein FliH